MDIGFRTSLSAIILVLLTLTGCGADEHDKLLGVLDRVISEKEQFSEHKQQRIEHIKTLYQTPNLTKEQEFELNHCLYEEYRKYQLDSAICYTERNLKLAEDVGDRERIFQSMIDLAPLYSFSGMYMESEKILTGIVAADLPERLKESYYRAYIQFYDHYGTASNQDKYKSIKELLRDSLLAVVKPGTRTWISSRAVMLLEKGGADNLDTAEQMVLDLLEETEPDTPAYASTSHLLARIYMLKDNTELGEKYYTISAITDIKCANRETSALQNLSLIFYDKGDHKKAFRYAQVAFEDAVAGGAMFRATQMSGFYAIINSSYQNKETATKNKLKSYLTLISILTFCLILLVGLTYNQMIRLSRAKEELSDMNGQLKNLNDEMARKNDLLLESNLVKEQYIAQFFDLCSEYISKLEDFRKSLNKLAMHRQTEELLRRLKSTEMVENQVEELYRHFDNVFLGLYPNFVSDFNSLLEKDERITPKAGEVLNRELRIYALLRLGITDSAKIATFLRCSMSTVYNYRTKARNRAAISRDDFEDIVMKIGTAKSSGR